MKKRIASLMLLTVMTLTCVGMVSAAIYNEKNYQACHDSSGKFIESKSCDPTACGCLFHEIEEFIKGLFD